MMTTPHPTDPAPPTAFAPGDIRAPRAPRPFSALEDAIAHAERPGAPMLMGFSVCLDRQLEPGTLQLAVDDALVACPMLAARRQRLSSWQRWPVWEWPATVPPREPRVVSRVWSSGVPLDAHWPALLDDPIPLDRGQLVRIVHLQGERHDALLLAVHHAAVDGMGALMFLQQLAMAYSRRSGAQEDVRVLGTVGELPSPAAVTGGRSRGAPAASPNPVRSRMLDVMRAPKAARVTPDLPVDERLEKGCGVTHRWVDAVLSTAISTAAHTACVTVTDLLVAALHLTIDDWNRGHGVRNDLVTVTVPVRSSTPLGHRTTDPTTNRTLQVTTETTAPQRVDPTRAVSMVSDQLAPVRRRDDDLCPSLGEPAANPLLGLLPERWRRQVPGIASAVSGDRFLATSRLSNLGAVPSPSLGFGDARVEHLGFSTPVRMPQGVTLGVTGLDGRLELAFRWSSGLFTDTSAGTFADLFVATLRRVAHA